MSVEANVLGKYYMAYGIEAEITYTCPHCGETVTETMCFSKELDNTIACGSHECYECGQSFELDVDLY